MGKSLVSCFFLRHSVFTFACVSLFVVTVNDLCISSFITFCPLFQCVHSRANFCLFVMNFSLQRLNFTSLSVLTEDAHFIEEVKECYIL